MLIEGLKILLIAIRPNPAMASGSKSDDTGSVIAIHDRKGVVVVDGGIVPVVGQTRGSNGGGIVVEVGRRVDGGRVRESERQMRKVALHGAGRHENRGGSGGQRKSGERKRTGADGGSGGRGMEWRFG